MFSKIKTIQDFQKRLLIIFSIVITIILVFLFSKTSYGQSVVVNGYFNAADPRDEWTELVIIDDNLDLRGWTLRDNNGSQTSWQTPITFNNIPFWNNMRAGTIIIIWHRVINSSAATNPEDTNKDDGYIQVNAQNSTYFTGGAFGTSPTWAGNTLNIAGSGEIIQIRNSSDTHIHALGHLTTPGTDWNALPTPKLNHANSASSGDAIYVCPGGNLSEYNGPGTGNAFTSKNSTTITFGLPNTCGSAPNDNNNFIRSLREPQISSQTVSATTSATYPTVALTFTWNAATDPVHTDQTQGYIIVRSTGVFGTPEDGRTYSVGDAITGGGTVIANIDNPGSSTISYTDYGANTSATYCYRVYAYRYGTDDLNGNTYNNARGRAYNTTNFITVSCVTNPLPITLLTFTTEKITDKTFIQWTTSSEINNDYFEVEHSIDGTNFNKIYTEKGAGNSNQILNYQCYHNNPFNGYNYYRLKQVDFDGNYTYSKINAVKFENNTNTNIYSYNDALYINSQKKLTNTNLEIYDTRGRIIMQYTINTDSNQEKVDFKGLLQSGMYIAIVKNEEFQNSYKFVVTK